MLVGDGIQVWHLILEHQYLLGHLVQFWVLGIDSESEVSVAVDVHLAKVTLEAGPLLDEGLVFDRCVGAVLEHELLELWDQSHLNELAMSLALEVLFVLLYECVEWV